MGDRVDEIMSLAKSRDVADRERLLIRLVDMCNRASDDLQAPRVQTLLSQVFFDLVFQAEFEIRLRLAEKIASADWAPSALISILSFDDIEIARPIIARSPLLKDPDLIRILVEATLEHQVEVARRSGISPEVIDAILKTARPEVMTALAGNPTAQVSEDHLLQLVQMAEEVTTLHDPLATHPQLNAGLAGSLYAWVGATLRKSLADRFDLDQSALDEALALSIQQATTGGPAELVRQDPSGETAQERNDRRLIAKMDMAGQLRPGYLLKALKEERLSLFVAALAALGRFEIRDVKSALRSKTPEAFALACVAVGVDRTVFPTLLAQVRALNGGAPRGGGQVDKAAVQTMARVNPKSAGGLFRKAVSRP
ncbi:MAG: DUF2336 domain-containing protein [Phenylobacterium sp.]